MKRRGGMLTVRVDPAVVSVAASIRSAAEAAPLLVVSSRAFGDLAAELLGVEAAAAYLLEVAEAIGHPIAVNVPTGPDASSTMFIPPKSWSEDRLRGWVGGHHEHLERQFGRVAQVSRAGPANRAARRRRKREN